MERMPLSRRTDKVRMMEKWISQRKGRHEDTIRLYSGGSKVLTAQEKVETRGADA